MLDREALEKRLADVEAALQIAINEANTILGAKRELEYLLSELAQGETTNPPAAEIGDDHDDHSIESR